MMRQVALGAVIAFGATVLVLSVWEPKAPVAVAPPPPAPTAVVPTLAKPFRPASLRPDSVGRLVRQPVMMLQLLDAGVPVP